jgi:hypothetical protein
VLVARQPVRSALCSNSLGSMQASVFQRSKFCGFPPDREPCSVHHRPRQGASHVRSGRAERGSPCAPGVPGARGPLSPTAAAGCRTILPHCHHMSWIHVDSPLCATRKPQTYHFPPKRPAEAIRRSLRHDCSRPERNVSKGSNRRSAMMSSPSGIFVAYSSFRCIFIVSSNFYRSPR